MIFDFIFPFNQLEKSILSFQTNLYPTYYDIHRYFCNNFAQIFDRIDVRELTQITEKKLPYEFVEAGTY